MDTNTTREFPPLSTIQRINEELNQLGNKPTKVDLTRIFNTIPKEDRTVAKMAGIIDKLSTSILTKVIEHYFPEVIKEGRQMQESAARSFVKTKITANVNNFFAQINGLAEDTTRPHTDAENERTTQRMVPLQEGLETTRNGCLALINPKNWFKK